VDEAYQLVTILRDGVNEIGNPSGFDRPSIGTRNAISDVNKDNVLVDVRLSPLD
jgi:hypothetical protein